MKKIIAFAYLCAVFASLQVHAQTNVAVTVTNDSGGVEAGVFVAAYDGSTYTGVSGTTDSNGVVSLTLADGDYRFRTTIDGDYFYTDLVNHCSVPTCNAVSYEVQRIHLTLTNNQGGVESGLAVTAFRNGTAWTPYSGVTDSNGQLSLAVAPGSYGLRISKSGDYFNTPLCDTSNCSTVDYEIALISLTVTSSGGLPEPGLSVVAYENGSAWTPYGGVTDSNGALTFPLEPGIYELRISKSGNYLVTPSCDTTTCSALNYEIQLVTLTVTSESGTPEPGLAITAFENGTVWTAFGGSTDTNGQLTFPVEATNYVFRIAKNGFTYNTASCTLPGCSALSYEFPLPIAVTVTNSIGDPVENIGMAAYDGNGWTQYNGTTDSSGIALVPVPAGTFKFRTASINGTFYESNLTPHCTAPGCTAATIQIATQFSDYVVDPNLGVCIDAAASANGWTQFTDFTALSCDNAGVTNLAGLSNFSSLADLSLVGNPVTLLGELSGLNSLTDLDLSGTTQLECGQLSSLEATLGTGVITHPATCLAAGDQIFSVNNPGQPDSNQFGFDIASTPYGDLISSAITFNPVTSSFDGRVYLIDGSNGAELLEMQNPNPSGSDYFGWSVAALPNGDIAVGAWNDEVGGVNAGVVFLFSGSDGSLLQTINNPNPDADDRFGYDLAVTVNGTLAVGAYQESGGGAVYLYDQQGNLLQTLPNNSSDTNAEFGKSVAANALGEVIVGAPKQDVAAVTTMTDAGVVYTYPEVGGAPLIVIDNPQPQVNDDFGSAIAVLNGSDIIVSARFVDNFVSNDGSVFVMDGTTGAELWSIANPVADVDGQFAAALAGTPQGHVVVGAANDDSSAANAGKVFVFDGALGDLIEVIDNPVPGANFNFGHGLAVTPAGQIAVGAFGADGGYGSLYLFASITTGSALDLLNDEPFNDANLQSCVLGEAATNGWSTVDEVTALDCASSAIGDLTGIEGLTSLTTLDLSDNPFTDITALESLTNLQVVDLSGNSQLLCTDLDNLDTALGVGVVTRPAGCDSGIIAPQVSNLHNAQGQRAVKTVTGPTPSQIHFIYDPQGQVIAEIDAASGQTLREYVYVNGMQIALVDDTGTQDEATYFVHTDHLATPQKITDDVQAVVWSGSYEPFGEVTETVAAIENNIRFPGQYFDRETSVNYNYFREFDSSLGRYLQSDPIGLLGGINTFVYVDSNTITFADPTGLTPECWFVPIGSPRVTTDSNSMTLPPTLESSKVIPFPRRFRPPGRADNPWDALPLRFVTFEVWRQVTITVTTSTKTQNRYMRCVTTTDCGKPEYTNYPAPPTVTVSESSETDVRKFMRFGLD